MFTVAKEMSFAAGHWIRGHQGKCRNPHGHNYRVRVLVEAEELDEIGMVIDFSDLKAAMKAVIDPLDHRMLNEIPPFDERNTSAELIAWTLYEQIAPRIDDERVRVSRVEVWETETCFARYEPPPRP